jgi:hypothetical protein
MNFEDESYVRLYVRDTKTWLRLGFEGQCVLMFLLRKLDKAGVLDGMDDLDSDVSLVTGVPRGIVMVGIPLLLRWGVFLHIGNRLVMPNYLTAQNAIRTDKARQRNMREKRLSQARLVTPRDADITPRDEVSRESPSGHATSRDDRLYSASLHSAPLHCAEDPERAPSEPEPPSSPEITQVIPVAPAAKFAPDTWKPNDRHRVRCQELRFDLLVLERAFRNQEFNRGYSDWDKRFSKWIEDEKIERETAIARQPRAGPARPDRESPKGIPVAEVLKNFQ